MRKIFPKYFILFFLSSILTGCNSFFEISKDEYLNEKMHKKTKVILLNGNEYIFEKPDSIKVSSDMDKIIFTQDSIHTIILIQEIKQIEEEKFDSVLCSLVAFGIVWFHLLFLLLMENASTKNHS